MDLASQDKKARIAKQIQKRNSLGIERLLRIIHFLKLEKRLK